MKFLKERGDGMLFPQPKDGEIVKVSPPGLTWLPAEGAKNYQVVIFKLDDDKKKIYEKKVGSDPVHLPTQVIESGEYIWDVIAEDKKGIKISRGEQKFIVEKNAPKLPWVDPDKLLKKVPPAHSRLLYSEKNLPHILKTLTTTRSGVWMMCKRKADEAIKLDLPRYPTYHKIEDPMLRRLEYKKYYRSLSKYLDDGLTNLSLAYLISKDKKYSEAGKRILLEIASWLTEDEDVTSVSSKWGDEPGLHIAKCAHRSYDWLYESFSEPERKQVLRMCELRAWQVYRRLKNDQNFLTFPGESHAGRLIAYLGEMAIVMFGEVDGTQKWLNYSLKALTTFYPHWGGKEGGWAEGMDYAKDYNSFYIPLFETLKTVCDFNLWQKPFFENIRYFFLYCLSPLSEMQPFGDGADRPGPAIKGEPYINLMAYYAHIFNDKSVGWWVDKIPSFKGLTSEYALLFEDKLPSRKPDLLPNSKMFSDVGWVGVHSNLKDFINDTFLLFKSSPFGSVSHSHADQNSFAIMKGGKALAIPSGYYGPLYGAPHHANWTRSTNANNSVLVDGEGQVMRSDKATGEIKKFENHKELTYLVGSAANAYGNKLTRFDRHILFVRPGVIFILDDLESTKAFTYQWLMHSFDKMKIINNKIMITRENAVLTTYLRCSEGLYIHQTSKFDTPYNEGVPSSFKEDLPNQWHMTASTKNKSSRTRIGAIMTVFDREKPSVKTFNSKGWFGAKIKGEFGEVEGWMQLTQDSPSPAGCNNEPLSKESLVCCRSSNGFVFSG